MTMKKRLTVAAILTLAGLAAACQPVHTRGVYDSRIGVQPHAPKVYRTVNGRVFATEAQRAAYLRRHGDAYERELYAIELERQRIRSQSLSALQADRRQAQIDRARRAEDRAERARTQALRDTRQAERAARRAEREARRQTRTDNRPQIGTQGETQAERRARRQAERTERQRVDAQRDQQRLTREAREAERRARRQARQQQRQSSVQNPRVHAGYSAQEIAKARRSADREGGKVEKWLEIRRAADGK